MRSCNKVLANYIYTNIRIFGSNPLLTRPQTSVFERQDDGNESENNCMLVFSIFELLKNSVFIEGEIEM